MTSAEQGFLYVLLTSRDEVPTQRCRSAIDAFLGRVESGTEQAVKVTLCRVRRKLQGLEPPVEIQTVYGFGFWLDDENRARLEERWENRPA